MDTSIAPECSGGDGDLFLCVYERRRELLPECGPASLETATRHVLGADQKTVQARVRGLLPSRT
jgi:hypothetical protein